MQIAAPDESFVAVAEPGGALTVWRPLLQRVVCPSPAPATELTAVSPDGRWVVVSRGRPDVRLGDTATCIADLQAGTARVVQGALDRARLDLATRTVFGREHGFSLDTGDESRAPDASFLRNHHITEWDGGHDVAMAHNGRYLAAWTRRSSLGRSRVNRRCSSCAAMTASRLPPHPNT
jgi:hypothetical protein